MKFYGLFFGGLLFLSSCEDDKKMRNIKPYKGAMIESSFISTFYSDSAKLKMRIKADKQYQFQNGDLEYPQGVDIVFFNAQKKESSHLTAQKGFFDKAKNIYTATGKVVVTDLIEQKVLRTEVLHWSPNQYKIYTDKFVVIQSGPNIIKGEGFTANQDFKYYKILKPTGSGIIKKKK